MLVWWCDGVCEGGTTRNHQGRGEVEGWCPSIRLVLASTTDRLSLSSHLTQCQPTPPSSFLLPQLYPSAPAPAPDQRWTPGNSSPPWRLSRSSDGGTPPWVKMTAGLTTPVSSTWRTRREGSVRTWLIATQSQIFRWRRSTGRSSGKFIAMRTLRSDISVRLSGITFNISSPV